MTRKTMTIPEFHAALRAQGDTPPVLICPACGTAQSMMDHIDAGATPEQAERTIGFSCFGRRIGAEGPRKTPDGKPCNWSLGGLFQIHTPEVIDTEGKAHPMFEPATPEQAAAYWAAK